MRLYDVGDPGGRVVGKVLRDQAQAIPEAVWLTADDRRVTFAEADTIVNRYARGLMSVGVGKGDPVAMLVEPSI